MQDVLALALLVVVAAPRGGVPGMTQLVWQFAACELQSIMQFVVVDVCASRIFAAADAAAPSPSAAATSKMTANTIADRRMTDSLLPWRESPS